MQNLGNGFFEFNSGRIHYITNIITTDFEVSRVSITDYTGINSKYIRFKITYINKESGKTLFIIKTIKNIKENIDLICDLLDDECYLDEINSDYRAIIVMDILDCII